MWFKDHWLRILAIFAVLGAFGPFPYVYYQLMNWIVVGASLMTAYQAYQQKKDAFMWLCIIAAVIFNPIAPLYLRQDVWRIADIVVVVLFLVSFFFIRGDRTRNA